MVGNNVKLIETEIRWWKALIDLYLGNSSFVEWLSANNFDTMAPALPACICANLWNGSITCKPLCVRCTQNARPIEVKWSGVAGKAEGLRKSINVYNYCRPLQKLRNHFYGLPFPSFNRGGHGPLGFMTALKTLPLEFEPQPLPGQIIYFWLSINYIFIKVSDKKRVQHCSSKQKRSVKHKK